MASDPFARMHSRLLARLGREAVFRGLTIKVGFEPSVAMSGEYGEVVARRDFAEIPAELEPKAGEAISIEGKDYVLDAMETTNGYAVRFVLR